MLKVIKFENEFIGEVILYNDEIITAEEIMKSISKAKESSKIITISKEQYDNIFNIENLPIKKVPIINKTITEKTIIDCVNAKRCESCGSKLCSEVCASYARNGSLVKDLRDWEINCNHIVLIDNQNRDKILYEGEVNRVLETIFRENMHLLYYFIIEASRVVIPEEDVDKFICYIDERR